MTNQSDAERLAFKRMQTEFIREDGTVEGWHIETHYTPCKGIADADGYMRVLVDEEGYDTETRISHKLLRETGWIQAARNPGAGLVPTPMVYQCCGRESCDGKDCSNSGPWYKVPKWRMDAYYYGFEPTGVAAIDKILSAVACAGKAYHHTEDWKEVNTSAREPHAEGASCQDWIQVAANEAASLLSAAPDAPQAASQAVTPCQNESMGKHACNNRAQCWEPCGGLGHSAEHARPSERNFCGRCGKRLGSILSIHTCTPPAAVQPAEPLTDAPTVSGAMSNNEKMRSDFEDWARRCCDATDGDLKRDKHGYVWIEWQRSFGAWQVATAKANQWRPIADAPKDKFINLYCTEDNSIWHAKWQQDGWFGVDEFGLNRVGRGPNDVTGWEVTHWQPLPLPPAGTEPQGGE